MNDKELFYLASEFSKGLHGKHGIPGHCAPMSMWTQAEKDELKRIVQSGWDWYFPGYKWVAMRLNSEFTNNRTIAAIKAMCKTLSI